MIALFAVLIPLNFALGLWVPGIALVVTLLTLVVTFALSRYRGLHRTGLRIYAIYSYALVVFSYFYNGGSAGSVLYYFLLTYQLLIAFIDKKLQWVWTALHMLLPAGLLVIEYLYPTTIVSGYDSKASRFWDLVISFPIIVIGIFLATGYLRKGYERERAIAAAHAKKIHEQNERIKAQNRLLQDANREKIELISVLGHDLRNPLNAITGTLEILVREEIPLDKRKKLQEDLLLAAHNTSDLLNNVLSWVSGQIKGIGPLLTWVEPHVVIDRVLDVQRYIAEKKGVSIRLEVKKGIKVLSDADMLELIIRNLINNALKFTPPGGIITISVTEDPRRNQCVLAVRDDGVGMAGEDVKNLFNGHIQSTYGTDSEKGIGLGLFLCRELTQRLDGKIWAESELGKGSTFSLALRQYDTDKNNEGGLAIPAQKPGSAAHAASLGDL